MKIEAKRVYLQEFRVENSQKIAEISNEKEIREYLPDWVASNEQRKEWLEKYEIPENNRFINGIKNKDIGDNWLKLGVFLKESDEMIGWCATGPKEELEVPNREIMYAISNKYSNQGYATEVTQTLINFLKNNCGINQINILARIDNIASIKVIEKCLFKYQENLVIGDQTFKHYIYFE